MAQVWAVGTECIGRYNFPGSSPHDLPFKKGDRLVIVAPSKDPNWYKARREDGLEGMIPFNYVQEKSSNGGGSAPQPPTQRAMQPAPAPTADNDAAMNHAAKGVVQLKTMPWFHGRISREDAEKLLTPPKNGRFLVRESQNYPGDYTLCVSYDNRVENYRVRRNDKGLVTVDDDEYFDNLIKLVEHYQKEADGLCTRLKTPVDKEGQHLFVVDVNDFKEKGWAIPKTSLLKKSLIGKGEFGEVWLGDYDGKKVAMKSMKDHLKDEKAKTQFLAEASVMTTLRHPNLVSLIGIALDDNPIYLITEFMAKGSLIDYLRSRGRAVITKQNQIDFARDVVKGMVYLESQNFVHRDLAARNVLISEDNVAKVSDFGLAKSNVNVKQEGAKLPVKWTAPEALRENKFSNKTDVWSFGILLWEIYSYGRVPYPRVPVEDVATHVESGYRMEAPEGCPDKIYKIMMDCWEKDPSQRPNFTRIEKALESAASEMPLS